MTRDGLTRDDLGKRTDKTGERDLTFNNWHRKYLSNKCYTTDIDFYEYRSDSQGNMYPKAFLEVKQAHVREKKYICSFNAKAIFHLAKRAGVKFFIVLYNKIDEVNLKCDFWVWEIKDESFFQDYDESCSDHYFKKYTNEELILLLGGL